MTSLPRRAILGSLLAATLAAAWWVEDEEAAGAAVEAVGRRQPLTPESLPQASSPMGQTVAIGSPPEGEASGSAESAIDPFRRKTWFVEPPPPPPPRPRAPPLPFRYLGQLQEGGEPRVFIDHQGRHLVIKAGDLIGGSYAVETVGAGQVVFVYLPLKERQVLPTGLL